MLLVRPHRPIFRAAQFTTADQQLYAKSCSKVFRDLFLKRFRTSSQAPLKSDVLGD